MKLFFPHPEDHQIAQNLILRLKQHKATITIAVYLSNAPTKGYPNYIIYNIKDGIPETTIGPIDETYENISVQAVLEKMILSDLHKEKAQDMFSDIFGDGLVFDGENIKSRPKQNPPGNQQKGKNYSAL
jgi:hypothetical protein